MIGTIRKHSQWLWMVIITVVIISFVAFFSPDAKLRGKAEGDYGTINGRPIRRAELAAAQNEARLGFFFRFQRWPGQDEITRQLGFDLVVDSRQKLVFNEAFRDLAVHVSDAAVVQQLHRYFRDTNGVFRPESYQAFVKRELNPAGMTEDDLERFMRHEIGKYHLASVFGLGGKLSTGRAAEAFYRRENEQVVTEAVFFVNSNQLAKVTLTTNALTTFFTNQLSLYRIPERVQVSYIHFAPLDFLTDAAKQMAALTNLNSQLELKYLQRGTNSFKDAAGKVLTPEAAREQLRQAVRDEFARAAAEKKAVEVANELFRMQPVRGTNLNAVAAKRGLSVKVTEPFTYMDGPKGLDVPDEFAGRAFKLSAEEPLTTPITGTNGAFLIAFHRKLTNEVPPFATVKEKVTADYQRSQAQELTMLEATRFFKAVTNGLAQGKDFQALCAEQKLTPVSVPSFSRATRELLTLEVKGADLGPYRDLAFDLPAGQAGPFTQTREGGYVMFVRARVPVSEEKLKEGLPSYAEQLRDSRHGYVFNDWFMKEWERTGMAAQMKRSPAGE